jgi:Mrp family chromosome partitioning ATPase
LGLVEMSDAVPPIDGGSLQAYSQIMQRIAQAVDLSEPRAIALTRGQADEGKTPVAINLERAAAHYLQRCILLIDGNLLNPQASARLGVHTELGLSEVLTEAVHPSEAICTVAPGRLDILGAGNANDRAVQLLGSRMPVLLWDLKESYDLIIVDTPHVTKDSVAQLLAGFDATYLIVKLHWTRQKAIGRAIALLQHQGIPASGRILTHTLWDLESNVTPKAEQPDNGTGSRPDTVIECPNFIALPDAPENGFCGTEENKSIDVTTNLGFFDESTTLVSDDFSALECPDPVTNAGDLADKVNGSASETLRKLETLRPFEPEVVPATPSSDPQLITPDSYSGEPRSPTGAESGPKWRICDSRTAHQVPGESLTSLARPAHSLRIPRVSRGLLQSNIPNTVAAQAYGKAEDPWAADVLAVVGLLLIAASILYVAGSALLWF